MNWAFTETFADLAGSIWLLATGFYKASASSLRTALDVSTASLYFQIRQNDNPGGGYDEQFRDWDAGIKQTPNWGTMKPRISQQPAVKRFVAATGNPIVEDAHRFFGLLCGYTHSAAYATDGQPVTAINTTGSAPDFDERYFERGVELFKRTISTAAGLWQASFPGIASTDLGSAGIALSPVLFPPPTGPALLTHR